MSISSASLLAGFCWLNFAALIWAQLLGIMVPSVASGLTTAIFFVVALSTSIALWGYEDA